jgi:hypothetical protein
MIAAVISAGTSQLGADLFLQSQSGVPSVPGNRLLPQCPWRAGHLVRIIAATLPLQRIAAPETAATSEHRFREAIGEVGFLPITTPGIGVTCLTSWLG